MKIYGSKNQVVFDFENGYVAKASGEMLINRKFVVYTNTLTSWEPPHNNEPFMPSDVQRIMDEVKRKTTEQTAQLIFE